MAENHVEAMVGAVIPWDARCFRQIDDEDVESVDVDGLVTHYDLFAIQRATFLNENVGISQLELCIPFDQVVEHVGILLIDFQ